MAAADNQGVSSVIPQGAEMATASRFAAAPSPDNQGAEGQKSGGLGAAPLPSEMDTLGGAGHEAAAREAVQVDDQADAPQRGAVVSESVPRPRAQKVQRRGKHKKTRQLSALRPRAQASEDADADSLKSWLRSAMPGWWDVTENGKGFVLAFRWRNGEDNPKQTFPRLSRKAYFTLKEMNSNERQHELAERIAGHLEELCLDAGRRDRARIVAARIGVELENRYQLAG